MTGWQRGLGLAVVLVVALAACGGGGDNTSSTRTAVPGGAAALAGVTFRTAGGGTAAMKVEVADQDELRFCGLMHRLSMPDDQGMLFVFDVDSDGPFWNRNTFIPLTLAWIAVDGRIVDLTDMPNVHPQDNPQQNAYIAPNPSAGKYRYVIEANQGWFARHKVSVGDRAEVGDAIARGSQGAVPICREKGL